MGAEDDPGPRWLLASRSGITHNEAIPTSCLRSGSSKENTWLGLESSSVGTGKGTSSWECPPPGSKCQWTVSDVAPAAWTLLSELGHRPSWTSGRPQLQVAPPSSVHSLWSAGYVRLKELTV